MQRQNVKHFAKGRFGGLIFSFAWSLQGTQTLNKKIDSTDECRQTGKHRGQVLHVRHPIAQMRLENPIEV